MSEFNRSSNNLPARAKLGSGQEVSMQVLQDIYNEFTGRSEKLSKTFNCSHHTTFDDLKQLNEKIKQTLEQYNVVSGNCAITLYFLDQGKIEYSAFERFELYDQSSLSAVENVRIKYSFLIILPQTDRAQSYEIDINVHSRAAIRCRAERDSHSPRSFLYQFLSDSTGMAAISFVDYSVARNFMVVIEDWFAALEQSNLIPPLSFLKNNSHHFGALFRYMTALVLLSYFYLNSENWVRSSSELYDLFVFGLLCFGSVYVVAGIAYTFGNNSESLVDSYLPLSYLKLTRGDAIVISKQRRSGWRKLIFVLINVGFAVVANVLAIWAVRYFGLEN